MDPLLRAGDTISISATEAFAVSVNFAPDLRPEARVLIASILSNFGRWFFTAQIDPAPACAVEWLELQRNASNTTILNELGGVSAAETSLATAYALMLRQNAGQPGPLATNGWSNVFYVRDAKGLLRSVNVHWCDGGWSVEAMQVEIITELSIRDRVFRNASHDLLRSTY
jgi:hypothetical protein